MLHHLPLRQWLTACAILLVAFFLLKREYSLIPQGLSRAVFCDVGQGDSILLTSPSGRHILIDGGPDLSALRCLGKSLPFFSHTIDLLVLTHPDDDHVTALAEVLRRYPVKQVLLTGVQNPSGPAESFFAELAKQKIPVMHPELQSTIDFGDGLTLDVLWPDIQHLSTETNETSVVLRARGTSGSILLTGDLPENGEARLLATGQDVQANILKIGHHGSKTSTTEGFLKAVQPATAVICVGKQNKFGHPAPATLERLRSENVQVRTTAEEGAVGYGF
ncbi:MAG: MBL fold metallo-hydrolase [Candidatus Peregrinibacteria bacterium]